MNKIKVFAAMMLIVCMLYACSSDSSNIPELNNSIKSEPDIETVKTGDLYDINYYSASVVPTTSDISINTPTVISKIYFSVGDRVNKGDVLISFENGDNEDALTIEADTTNVECELLKLDISILEEYIRLLGEPENELKLIELEKLKIELKYSEYSDNTDSYDDESYDKTIISEITAPCDGYIVYRTDAAEGEKLPAYSIIFTIAENKPVITCEYIPESVITEADEIYVISDNKKINLKPDENVSFSQVFMSDGTINTVFYSEELSNDAIGTFLPVYVIRNKVSDTVYIPIDSLHTDEAGNYYVNLRKDNGDERTEVLIGLITDTSVQILSGIQEGDKVIVSE